MINALFASVRPEPPGKEQVRRYANRNGDFAALGLYGLQPLFGR